MTIPGNPPFFHGPLQRVVTVKGGEYLFVPGINGLEFLASAVRGKRSGFETLREVAESEPRLDKAELDRLIDQANRQLTWLTQTPRDVAAAVFGGRKAAVDSTDL